MVFAFLVVFLTSALSGVLGMGGGIILAGVLGLLLPLPMALFLHAVVQLTANSHRGYLHRYNIQWRILVFYSIGLAIISVSFALLSLQISKPVFFLLLGVIALSSHFWPSGWRLNAQKPTHAMSAGMSVGALQLFVGVGGPLLDIFFQRTHLNRYQIVATKAATQTLGHFTRLCFYGALSFSQFAETALSIQIIVLAILLAMLGTALGSRILNWLKEAQFALYSKRLLIGVGVFYVVRGSMGLLNI